MKIFRIKGEEIKIQTAPDGRKAPTSDSVAKLIMLTMKYGDSLRNDIDAKEMAKYIK